VNHALSFCLKKIATKIKNPPASESGGGENLRLD